MHVEIEAENILVEFHPLIHVLHIGDHVIDHREVNIALFHHAGHRLISRGKTGVWFAFDESVNGVAINGNGCAIKFVVLIERPHLFGAAAHRLINRVSRLLHPKCHVAHATAMLVQVPVHEVSLRARALWFRHYKINPSLPYHMGPTSQYAR